MKDLWRTHMVRHYGRVRFFKPKLTRLEYSYILDVMEAHALQEMIKIISFELNKPEGDNLVSASMHQEAYEALLKAQPMIK